MDFNWDKKKSNIEATNLVQSTIQLWIEEMGASAVSRRIVIVF